MPRLIVERKTRKPGCPIIQGTYCGNTKLVPEKFTYQSSCEHVLLDRYRRTGGLRKSLFNNLPSPLLCHILIFTKFKLKRLFPLFIKGSRQAERDCEQDKYIEASRHIGRGFIKTARLKSSYLLFREDYLHRFWRQHG